ncbi:type II toxin-antitoxin system RelE family toxin [Ignatzschineria cameli]|uniref:Type II toxin-antitoxin system mRNA interferase toxin, RelE/StbE family n=1 Tax=Ignatzschineria cameli TaxID=2182793 RepID=A0A2U2AQS0_9GAMM|nr:type II toxin-antitoxin system RelE/ParE family toxin [Ignatzschineria cameli]PWD86236.1 type II toxin-antitoxin system mRNA interferase toxin, RelE/StbE family [Ignatzschineria cameli]PWD89927.1 type II toxin-antitoxin system mRNA interferase toxin, RelE/StbE family [Ignatzschineria cameli]PWD91577.1 type II toxin-antitoxin system mRNA interferase toxin, RelE/StbE family [Ignatzschineria cameli]PWD92614.1 type II toxin-antitoxin system mRNA interferase toxin, RelE/StbE family [Ignatzschiner
MYQVIYTAKALKSLQKIDKTQALFILNWIEKNLVGCSDPRVKGKALKGNLADWRYRVGDYHLLCNILDREIIIEVINVGHRKEIYK